ncbi:MAG TPA: carboxylate-amine ligase [Gemmatimonadaceae bacterium]|jgi:carboxylate-amine ligase|nr:carboxylate-amine ligase [Gemmatimonadaceae bacterium]
MKAPSLTLGIEEEYQIIDPASRELTSYITEILTGDHMILDEVKPELHQSMVEIGSRVCRSPTDLREELVRLRGLVMDLAAKSGLVIAAAGTHPFSSWMTQEITPLERYAGVKEDLQDLAQQLLIFGTHIHVGIEDRDFLIEAQNVARYLLPHVLCLSASSPFWQGRRTGLKSYRSIVFRNFPRTGVPPIMRSYAEFEELLGSLVATGSVPDGSKIWWDVRPHHAYPTLEFRVCDVCTRVEEATCIAAILQAIVAKIWKLRRDNLTFRVYPSLMVEENKWRAVRFGLDGKLIDFGQQKELPARELISEMLQWFVDDVVDELGSRAQVEYAFEIMKHGTSADRQLAMFDRTGDLKRVVDQVISETAEGVRPEIAKRFGERH